MKALAVYLGQPNSMHLREVEEPYVSDIPESRGALVRVLRVGVDGTDKDINAAAYGDAPDGFDYLITGRESLGRVLQVGECVPSHIRPGSLVGLQDMTTDDVYFESGCAMPWTVRAGPERHDSGR